MIIEDECMGVKEDIESYLEALEKLYSLLLVNNDRQSLQNFTSRDIILDEKARFLLKELLDGATENVLRTVSVSEGHNIISSNVLLPCNTERAKMNTSYSLKSKAMQGFYKFVTFLYQVIVSIFGLSGKHSSNKQQQSQDSLDSVSVLTRSQNTNVDVDKQTGKNLQGQPTNKRVPDDEKVQSVASVAAELLNRKKRCRICRRSSTKKQKFEHGTSSAVETEDINKETTNLQRNHQVDAHEKVMQSYTKPISDILSNKELQERFFGFQFIPSVNEAPVHSYNRDASGAVTSGALQNFAKEHKDIYCISKDAFDAIKTIDSCISALKVGGKQTEPARGVFKFVAGSVSASETSSPNTGNKAALAPQGNQTEAGLFMLGNNDSHSLLVRRRDRKTKGLSRWRQLSRYVVNPQVKLPNQSMRSYASPSPWNAESSKSLYQNSGEDDENNLRDDTFSQVEELTERQKLGSHNASSVHVKNVKTNVGRAKSLNRTKNSPRRTNSVQDLRIPLKSDKKYLLLDKLPRKTNKLILDRNPQKRKFSKVVQTKPSVPALSAGNKHIQTRSKMAATRMALPRRKTMNQTLRDPVMYGDWKEIDRGEVKKKINVKGKQRLVLSDQQESNGTTSHGGSSSSWTTQQGSTSYHDHEEYSVTEQSQSSHHSATSASSESEGNNVSGSTQGLHTGSPSYSDSQLSSAPSSTQSLEDSNSRSENAGYLLSDRASSIGSSYQQGHYSGRYRSPSRKRPKKPTGSLKKLKDKVAIIFHHHHHHHHHHSSDDSEQSDDQSQAYYGTPSLKHGRKMFKRRNQAETSGEKATEKLSKSMVHYAPNKKRGTNFNKLVGGLVRHVRHSKNSKKSKGHIEHQTKHQHVSKKLAKKVHWWQLLRRGRRPRRIKMPKKPRIKLGFGTKKSKLQAVPTIKWR